LKYLHDRHYGHAWSAHPSPFQFEHARSQDSADPSFAGNILTGNRSLVRAVGSLILPAVAPLVLFAAAAATLQALSGPYLILGLLAFFILFPGRWSPNVAVVDVGRQVLSPWALTLLLCFGIGLVTDTLKYFSREVLVAWAVFTPLLQTMLLHLMPRAIGMLVALRRDKHRVVLVGANEVALSFARALNRNPIVHSEVIGVFDDRAPPRLGLKADVPLIGKMHELAGYTRKHRVDQIYIALPLSSEPRIVRQLDDLRDCTASIYFLPDLMSMDLIQPRLDTHAGFPVVGVCESPFNGVDGVVKRASDVILAMLALLTLAPLMALIALAVKITSPGPVLFRQRRFGLDGSEIEVWKFRSMTVVEDGQTTYKQVVRGDPRLTRIGQFLRKTSLDELPQFFNVLQGTMSVVGPRPHAMMVNDQYRRQIPGYMVRHKVRPGITGWAQVHGYRGGDDLNSMTKRIEYDLEYLRRWSIWMDIRILARTGLLVVGDSRAY
jgi:putative colanic acid biosynthesis UDP-glucose lipid carrier transferase